VLQRPERFWSLITRQFLRGRAMSMSLLLVFVSTAAHAAAMAARSGTSPNGSIGSDTLTLPVNASVSRSARSDGRRIVPGNTHWKLGGDLLNYPGYGCLSGANDWMLFDDLSLEECQDACVAEEECKTIDWYASGVSRKWKWKCSLSRLVDRGGTATSSSDCRHYGFSEATTSTNTITATTATSTTKTATRLQVTDKCDPYADMCDKAKNLVCSMDGYECRYGTTSTAITAATSIGDSTITTTTATTVTTVPAEESGQEVRGKVYATTTAMAATTTTTAPAEASSGKQKSTVGVVGAAAGLVLLLVAFIGYRRCRNDASINADARISSFTANPSYPDLKAAPQTQTALITDGVYIDVETSTQAEESKYDNAFGNDGFSAAIAGFQEMLAPALPLEPYGTFVGGSDGEDEGAEREGVRSVDDSAPRVLNGTDAYLLSSSQQVVLYDAGDVPGIASNQLPVYSEIAEELFAAEPINPATQRCKYRQPGPGGQRCKFKTATEWCEKHTCGILACRNSKPSKDALCRPCLDHADASASQSMYEEPSQQQVQVYDDGGAPGAADHFAGGAYASVGNDQKAYGSITATHPGGMYDEIDGTYEGGEETYDGIDDDDISL